MAVEFNEEVQVDLLFWEERPMLHIVDRCTRFAAAQLVENRSTSYVLGPFTRIWLRIFGPPKRIVSDHEGAFDSDEGRMWATRWGFKLVFKPKKAHAQMVERHNDLLRDQVHLIKEQMELDGIGVDDDQILDEAVLANNVFVNTKGVSP